MSSPLKLMYASPSELLTAVDATIGSIRQQVDELAQRPIRECTFENTVAALSRILAQSQNILNVATFLQSVDPNPAIRATSEEADKRYTHVIAWIFGQDDLYARLNSVDASDMIDQRLQDILLGEFSLHPAQSSHRSVKKTKHYTKHPRVSDLSAQFEINLRELQPTLELSTEEIQGVSPDFLEQTRQPNGRHRITLDNTSQISTQCRIRSTREYVRTVAESYCPENRPILVDLIIGRTEIAQTEGWPSWTHLAVSGTMAQTPDRVVTFLNDLHNHLRPRVDRFTQFLTHQATFPVENYDVGYYHQKWLETTLGTNLETLWACFRLDRVVTKMLDLFGHLLGITFTRSQLQTWEPSVETYTVTDTLTGQGIGTLLCDLHPRPGKITYTATWVLRDGYYEPSIGQILPVVALVCNFSNPNLSLDGVETVMHEFGHALHGLLTGSKSRYAELAYNSQQIDWIEVPSQMMELWAHDPQVLQALSYNPQTHAPLTRAQAQAIIQGFAGLWNYDLLSLVTLSRFDDMVYRYPVDSIPALIETFNHVMSHDCPVDPHFPTYPFVWGHIGTTLYAGLYYIYLWSTAIAADLHGAFLQFTNVLDPIMGRRYRELILEPGNSVDPHVLIENFLGRPFNLEALFNLISRDDRS
jgi:thimet oligopeptidase